MDGLETTIVNISEDALDELFDETPDKTVNADTLLGGQKGASKQSPKQEEEEFEDVEEDIEEDEEAQKRSQKKKAVPKQPKVKQQEQLIEEFDSDEFEDEEVEEPEEEEEEKPKKASKKSEAPEKVEEDGSKNEGVFSVLKNTVNYLVEQGVWDDFDNREEMDIDEDTYAKLVIEQDKRRVQGMFEEMVDSTGPFGKAIIDYVKNGGNPDEIIDLFKEQKQVDSINIENLDGQKDIIKHYYTEVMGWKSERAEKYISNLVLSNELESEAQEVKELFSSYYQKEASRLNQEREQFAARQQEAEQAFESNIKAAVKERKDLTPNEKKLVENTLLRYDQKLPNGNMVNKFYVEFAKMQANPADYIDLVLFVMDKQKFVQKVATKEKTQAAASAFQFIKGNGAVSSKKGSSYEQIRKNDKVTGFDWGLPSK
jgi:hypothetical protein